ncbi:hypothetical protein N9I04_03730 [Alphaproteobacteria bacterium]|nr:hypothetical protein [Alphaproteobacteria bacterium]
MYIVHCIDTEGPLFESLTAKFDRLAEVLGITGIAVSQENLRRLQNREIDLNGMEVAAAELLSSGRSSTLGTWGQVDSMLDRVTSPKFRSDMVDSLGNGWVYNWFCMDHVGFEVNPRRRDMGYHNILDHYQRRITDGIGGPDEIHWHFHPVSTYREAHRCATHYLRTDEVFQVLARRIIERHWFPCAYRAGFQAERPDSHWLLEQYVPFDFTNMALDDPSEFEKAIDFRNGRSGDWRRAPADWSAYHPSHDDYQRPGACRRWILRCLNITSRVASIDQKEVDKAFARATAGEPTIIGVCSHDFRDLEPEVKHVRNLIQEVAACYKDTPFYFSGAIEAVRAALPLPQMQPLELSITMNQAKGDVPSIDVKAIRGQVFGPQPFLAIKIRGNRFIHDNLDFGTHPGNWSYAFHVDTLPLEDVEAVGVGAADATGNTAVAILRPDGTTF